MARSFNGSTQYLGVSSPLVTTYPFTVSVWFRVSSLPSGSAFLWSISSTGATQRYFSLFINGGAAGKPLVLTRSNGFAFNISAGPDLITTGVWYNAVCEVEANIQAKLHFLGTTYLGVDDVLFPSDLAVTTVGGYRYSGGFVLGAAADMAEFSVKGVNLVDQEVEGLTSRFSAKHIRPQNTIGDDWTLAGSGADEVGLRGTILTNTGSAQLIADHPPVFQ